MERCRDLLMHGSQIVEHQNNRFGLSRVLFSISIKVPIKPEIGQQKV